MSQLSDMLPHWLVSEQQFAALANGLQANAFVQDAQLAQKTASAEVTITM
jgi:hypothetical protein